MHRILHQCARSFALSFLEWKKTAKMTFEQIIETIKTESDSDSRQLQVVSAFEGLTFDGLTSARSVTLLSERHQNLLAWIQQLTPQCPPVLRTEENKVLFLRSAVLRFSWAEILFETSSPNVLLTQLRYCPTRKHSVGPRRPQASKARHRRIIWWQIACNFPSAVRPGPTWR